MDIKLGETYFYQGVDGCKWLKPTSIKNDFLNYITSFYLKNIYSVRVKNIADFLIPVYKLPYTMDYIIYGTKLNEPFDEEVRDKISPHDWFDTWQEEIDGDFNGDIHEWMNWYKLDKIWVEPTDKYERKIYEYRHIRLTCLDESDLIIPYKDVRDVYPDLVDNQGCVVPLYNEEKLSIFKRNYYINKLL